MACDKCRKRDNCQTPCDRLEAALEVVPLEDPCLVFFKEPRVHLEDGDAFYMSRMPNRDARLLSLYDALRPLYKQDDMQAAAVFILMNYFGASQDDIGSIFKIRRRRVNAIIQRTKDVLGCFQDGADVPEPRGYNRPGGSREEDDMPEVSGQDDLE